MEEKEITEKTNKGHFLQFYSLVSVLMCHFSLNFPQSLFSPTCFSYASQYVSRYETQGEGMSMCTTKYCWDLSELSAI